MTEIRCKKCNRLLFKHYNELSVAIYIKCPKCGYHQNVGLRGLETNMERAAGIRRINAEMHKEVADYIRAT